MTEGNGENEGLAGAALMARLAAPFSDTKSYKQGGATLTYIDARQAAQRLDEVFGPLNWAFDWELVDAKACVVKGILSINTGAYWVTKADAGYPNMPPEKTANEKVEHEHIKEAVSDSLKRCAVLMGIARYLYGEAPKGSSGGYPATEGQVKYIRDLLAQHGFPEPAELAALPKPDAGTWIETLKARGPDAVLTHTGTGEVIKSNFRPVEDGELDDIEPHVEVQSRATDALKPATANQVATIQKLSRLLGEPESGGDLSVAEASERITVLAREYNERKGAARSS